MAIIPYKTQLKEFLTLGLDRCMQSVQASSGSIFLLDNRKKELILEIARSPKKLVIEGVRTRLGERVAGRVAKERKAMLVEDIDDELPFSLIPRYSHYHSKSFLSVPLEYAGQLMGVVSITDKARGSSFDDNDQRVVESICDYLGIALYSLKNYLDKQKRINSKLNREITSLKKSMDQNKKYSSLGKLMGGLVHEINNPLDGVMRYVNLASHCLEENEAAREYLTEAKGGLKRIATIVRSLLDFAWSLSNNTGCIDINRTLEESLFMLNHYIVSHNVTVKKVFTNGLPQVHDYRLKLAFNNIIRNACEAMSNGGTLTVYTAFAKDNSIEVRIKDTGCGIAAEKQHKIFEPFYTTKTMGEGSGLGLAISCEIVQRYNGTIFLESHPGRGTSFVIQIPIEKSY